MNHSGALTPFAVLSLLMALGPGCVPVAMFPSEHRLATGLVGGAMRGAETEPTHAEGGAHFTYRGTISPLAMVPQLWDRDFDFGLGYFLMVSEVGSLQHGPTLDLSYFVVRETFDERPVCEAGVVPNPKTPPCRPADEHQLFRFALRAEADLRFSDAERNAVGFGGRLGVRFDFSWLDAEPQPAESVGSRGGFVGVTWGEYGLAVDVLGGGGFVGAQAYGEFVIGLTLRAPAIAGIAIGVP